MMTRRTFVKGAAALAATPAMADSELDPWQAMGRSLSREHGFEPAEVLGTLPTGLNGTLYRNGPGLLESFGKRYAHLFDGDGAITAFRFFGGGAQGASRVLETPELLDERAAGKMLYTSGATPAPTWGKRVGGKVKNTANTSVLAWAGQTLALWEGGAPTAFDPNTLDCLGQTKLGGTVQMTFSAHPHAVAARGKLYNFGLRYGRDTLVDLYELNPDGTSRLMASHPLPAGTGMLHDFIATEKHFVFFVSPLVLSPWLLLAGVRAPLDTRNFSWKAERGTDVMVVPIDEPTKISRFRTDAFWQWHFANAFDDGDDVVVDFSRYRDASSFTQLGTDYLDEGGIQEGGFLHRARVSPKTGGFTSEQVWDMAVEFPKVHPGVEGSRARYAWGVVSAPNTATPDGLSRIDAETGDAVALQMPDGWFPTEPVPVAKGDDELDVWVLSLVWDSTRDVSGVAVWDGHAPEAGPVGSAWLDHPVPITFHGAWAPA